VDLEWRKQAIEETDDTGNIGSDIDFWKKCLSQKVLLGDLKYPNLRKVVACLMSLPFSNAPVERLFSALKIVKSDCRNSLKRENLVGLLHTQQGMKPYNLPAEKLNVADHPELLKLVRKVKSNATDSEAQRCIANSMCGSSSFD